MTARAGFAWVRFMEYDELLYGRRFPLSLKGTPYMTYIRPVFLYAVV